MITIGEKAKGIRTVESRNCKNEDALEFLESKSLPDQKNTEFEDDTEDFMHYIKNDENDPNIDHGQNYKEGQTYLDNSLIARESIQHEKDELLITIGVCDI